MWLLPLTPTATNHIHQQPAQQKCFNHLMINSHVQINLFSVLHLTHATCLTCTFMLLWLKCQIYSNYLLHMTLKMTSAGGLFRHAKSVKNQSPRNEGREQRPPLDKSNFTAIKISPYDPRILMAEAVRLMVSRSNSYLAFRAHLPSLCLMQRLEQKRLAFSG
jgi:hypothetical protein